MTPTTVKGRRDARTRAQRDRILDAAQKCFTERGFHGASMAMIADTAQMSPGLIYRYFAGKSELIHGIVSRQIELMADDLDAFKSGERDAIDRQFRPRPNDRLELFLFHRKSGEEPFNSFEASGENRIIFAEGVHAGDGQGRNSPITIVNGRENSGH